MLFAEQLQLALMSAEELVHEPDLGVPLGLALHGLSLLSQVILPDSSFSLTASSRRHTRLFGSKRRSEGGYSAYLGNLLAAQRGAALSFAVCRLFDASNAVPHAFVCAVYCVTPVSYTHLTLPTKA